MQVYEISENEVKSIQVELALEEALKKLESGAWSLDQHRMFIMLLDQEEIYAN